MWLSLIIKAPGISNEKHSISIEIPSISIENLGFWSKYQVFRVNNFEILGFSHREFEVIRISSEIPSTSKYLPFWKLGISTK